MATRRTPKLLPESTIDFWRGDFGNDYLTRNNVAWRGRMPFFKRMIERTNAESFLDVGTNCGWNLLAIRELGIYIDGTDLKQAYEMSGCEPNEKAAEQAKAHGLDIEVCAAHDVAEKFGPECADLVMTSGVLIHIAPADLKAAMAAIVKAAKQYVLAIEYEAPEEQMVVYREHQDRLWKRPFGKLYTELGLRVIDHGEAEGFDQCQYVLLEK